MGWTGWEDALWSCHLGYRTCHQISPLPDSEQQEIGRGGGVVSVDAKRTRKRGEARPLLQVPSLLGTLESEGVLGGDAESHLGCLRDRGGIFPPPAPSLTAQPQQGGRKEGKNQKGHLGQGSFRNKLRARRRLSQDRPPPTSPHRRSSLPWGARCCNPHCPYPHSPLFSPPTVLSQSILVLVNFFSFFLWLYLWHLEVPKLRVEL